MPGGEARQGATRRDTEKPGYHTQMSPNARLAGLVRKAGTEDGKPLVPFVFAEVHLPNARPGQTPTLHGRLPSSHWVFCWDERRRTGYLLATPRSQDTESCGFMSSGARRNWRRGRGIEDGVLSS